VDNHIDWISFTLVEGDAPRNQTDLYHAAKTALRKVSKAHESYIYNGFGFETTNSRTPYRYAIAREDHGVRLYGGSPTNTILVEISGRACEGIREFAAAKSFVDPLCERLTRIDFACDVRTNTAPNDFYNTRSHKRFRSASYITSQTGTTVYSGSPKSDRFCRIYRYNPPHPRSELLRVEFVFRGELAKAIGVDIQRAESEAAFVSALGNTWGWQHKDWTPGIQSDEKVTAPIISKHGEETLAWLYKQVLPAMAKLMARGELDMTDFLEGVYERANKMSADG